jgi:hypothetical protein
LIQILHEKVIKIPAGPFCHKCGPGAHAFPDKTPEQVIEMAKNNRKIRAELIYLSEMVSDPQPALRFQPSIVMERHTLGVKLTTDVAIVTDETFLAVFKLPVEKLTTTASLGKVFKFVDPRDGSEGRGVAMALDSVPENVPHFRAQLFSQTETFRAEYFLRDVEHIRQEQADASYSIACSRMMTNRPEPLRSDKVWTYSEWKEKVEPIQQKRQAAEAEAAARINPAEEDADDGIVFGDASVLPPQGASSSSSAIAVGPSASRRTAAATSSGGSGGPKRQKSSLELGQSGLTQGALAGMPPPVVTPQKGRRAASIVSSARSTGSNFGGANSDGSVLLNVVPDIEKPSDAKSGRAYNKQEMNVNLLLAGLQDGRTVRPVGSLIFHTSISRLPGFPPVPRHLA